MLHKPCNMWFSMQTYEKHYFSCFKLENIGNFHLAFPKNNFCQSSLVSTIPATPTYRKAGTVSKVWSEAVKFLNVMEDPCNFVSLFQKFFVIILGIQEQFQQASHQTMLLSRKLHYNMTTAKKIEKWTTEMCRKSLYFCFINQSSQISVCLHEIQERD